jgi:hypothetical protein
MEAAHTATPWNLRKDGQSYNGQSIEAACMGNGYYAGIAHTTQRDPHPTLGGGIDQVTAEANAAFIVRACNAHDDLVNALKGLIRAGHALAPSSHEWNAAHDALAKAGVA